MCAAAERFPCSGKSLGKTLTIQSDRDDVIDANRTISRQDLIVSTKHILHRYTAFKMYV